jgi:hypothetical protein
MLSVQFNLVNHELYNRPLFALNSPGKPEPTGEKESSSTL